MHRVEAHADNEEHTKNIPRERRHLLSSSLSRVDVHVPIVGAEPDAAGVHRGAPHDAVARGEGPLLGSESSESAGGIARRGCSRARVVDGVEGSERRRATPLRPITSGGGCSGEGNGEQGEHGDHRPALGR